MNRKEFLNWLYEYCDQGQIETRALPGKKQAFHNRGDWSSIDKFCKANSKQNLYFSVATRNGGGTKEHIAQIPGLWADIDFKDYPGETLDEKKTTARKTIYEFPLRPSVMTETGGGYQPIWRLKEPAGKQDIPEIENILKALAEYLNADQGATDASRILRLPETVNHKYDNKPAVKVVWDNRTLEYNPWDFENLPPLTDLLFNNKLERVGVSSDSEADFEGKKRDIAGQNGTERDILYPINFLVGHHDHTLFSIAWHLAKGGMPETETLKVIEYTAKTLDPGNETKRWAREKVRSAYSRLDRKNRNLAEEIREWVRDTSGTFCGTEVDKELEIGTKRDKENRKKVLQRLLAEGILERVGGKNNVYRRIETECDEIDFLNAPTEEIALSLPLDLSKYFKAYRKNIIVIAGDQDAGKTALLLNIVRDNMDKHEIHYFSSEMASSELRIRLNQFNDLSLQHWNFNAYERSDNFADVIRPNSINIIDYLEIHDTFYQIGERLREIHDKLQEGIADLTPINVPPLDLECYPF